MKIRDTEELENWIEHADKQDLHHFVQESIDIDLSTYLHELLNRYDFRIADIINKAQLPRTYGYQIFQGVRLPGRDKVLQLAFAMGLDLDETNRFLKIAKKSPLYVKTKRDAILIFAIHKQLDLYQTNLYLDDYHMPILGDCD